MKASQIYEALTHFTKERLPAFVWGPPGIGKSSIVKQIASDHDYQFIDLRLSLLDPTDLKGIPFFDSARNEAVWASPDFLPKEPDSRGILFLDEINTAAPSVQAAAYQLVLDRKVGDYELPEGWSIIAAGNRENDRGVTFRMPPPLANRFVHLEMAVDFEDWKAWAYHYGIDAAVIGYLSFDKSKLFDFDPTRNERSFPTPRSWEYVHRILHSGVGEALLHEAIAGAIGKENSVDFLAFRKVMHRLPDIEAIVSGELKAVEEEDTKVLFALCAGLVNRLQQSKEKEEIDNVLAFSLSLPGEFAIMLVKDMQKNGIPVENAPQWEAWVQKFSYLLA
ncbi:MAG TPA: MoxR family ATPase [Campylobacteraceae bacterium]|nr:MoxR family ATPase [Campylobacteraceae bacterium]